MNWNEKWQQKWEEYVKKERLNWMFAHSKKTNDFLENIKFVDLKKHINLENNVFSGKSISYETQCLMLEFVYGNEKIIFMKESFMKSQNLAMWEIMNLTYRLYFNVDEKKNLHQALEGFPILKMLSELEDGKK